MYLMAISFERVRKSPYGAFYRKQRAFCESDRRSWNEGRKRYYAMRKTAKLFLAHLWEVWMEAEGKAIPDTYATAFLEHDKGGEIRAWEMVKTPEQKE
jgi:hypothetical protein